MKKGMSRKLLSLALSAVMTAGMFSVAASADNQGAAAKETSEIQIAFPLSKSDKTVVGNKGIEITGTAKAAATLTVTAEGKKVGTATAAADGGFTAKIPSYALSSGLNDIVLTDGKDASATVEIVKQNYYDLAAENFTLSNAGQSFKQTGVSKYCPDLSVGGQTVKTKNGFSVVPANGQDAAPADAVFDLTKFEGAEYFHAVVGIDDFANIAGSVLGSVKYSVLADGKEIAETRTVTMNEKAEISAEIPKGAKKLTLRVENADGNNQGDYADWIDPRVFIKAEDYGFDEANLFDGSAAANLSAKASVGALLNVRNGFSAVTLTPEKASETVSLRLYKYNYSYVRSLQNGILCEVKASADSEGNYKFALDNLYTPGEYLFVFDGVTGIKASGSKKAYVFADSSPAKGLLNMSLTLSGKNANLLALPTAAPDSTVRKTEATDAEKTRARETYDNYLKNLANFPSKMTIDGKEYVGFSDKDFLMMSQKTEANETTKSENTDTEILHSKSGIKFTLKTVFYPDYAAFDWVIYFSNMTAKDSPVVSDLSPAELTFEGDNPIILTSCSDNEAITGTPAPYTPRSFDLEQSESLSFKPTNGRSTEAAFPYYNLEYGGKGAFVVTSWAGQWINDFSYDKNANETKFSGRQETFSSYLKPGETARTPLTAVILYDGRDTDRATNLWRRWMIDCNMYKKDGKTNIEPFIAGLPKEMMDFSEEEQIENIKDYFKYDVNIDYWWMDAGWYPDAKTKGWGYVGSWEVDRTRYKTGLKAISDACSELNMKGGTILWFEPERNAFSFTGGEFEKYGVKKEWMVGYDAQRNTALGPNGYRMFDLGNAEALSWMSDRINKVLNEGGISFYREDLNTGSILSIWRAADTADRVGIVENRYVQGHYALWDNILANENINMIDTCASGGHRLDLETMRRSVALHPTDYNYNDMPAKHQGTYGLACWFPFAGANTGFGEYAERTSKYNMRSAYRQSIACQVHLDKLSDAERKIVSDSEKEWRNLSKFFYDDVYELTNNTASVNEWYAYSYVNSESQQGFALVFNHGGEFSPESQNIRLKGLEENALYEVTFADFDGTVTASGAELMSVGVSLTLTEKEMDQKVDSDIIYFKKIGGGVLYGDTDGSGDISVTDALLALQGSVGKIGLTDDQAAAADVDGDGKITVTDALLILQKSVGKIDKFPVEN